MMDARVKPAHDDCCARARTWMQFSNNQSFAIPVF